VAVTDTALRAYQGPWLTVNPDAPDELAVAFQDGNSFPACWLALSSDGGESWEQIALVGDDSVKPLPEGFYICFRPTLASGSDGTIYYAYVASQGGTPGPNAIYLVTSFDGGETFEDPVAINTAALPPGNSGDGVPRMATDPRNGRLYVAWQQVKGMPPTAQDILVAHSDDGGQTFSAPVQVNTPVGNGSTPNLDVGPDGRVYVTFALSARPTPDPAKPLPVQVATSSDGGATFGSPVTAQEEHNCALRGANTCAPVEQFRFEGRNTAGPQIVAGRSAGDVHLVSYGLESGLGDDLFRVRFSSSHDGGATWSRARTIGIPPGADAHHQITPSISRAPNGRLDIVFYDLAAPSQLENTYLISSSDGGRSFGSPRLLSAVPSDTNIRPAFGFGQGPVAGSRLVASTDDSVYSAWTDSRRGDAESAKLDIFSARLSLLPALPEPPEPDYDPPSLASFSGCPALTAGEIRGTAASNAIVGTLGAERIFAEEGNDFVEALAGDDCVDLGPGRDTGHGGSGADLMIGGSGGDRLHGSGGADRMRGADGDDRLSGGRARDRISGGAGADRVSGGSGSDRISGGSGSDRILGGAGGDRISGGAGSDRVVGGAGGDRISARDHRRDRVSCGRGRDLVVADPGDRLARDCERVRRRG